MTAKPEAQLLPLGTQKFAGKADFGLPSRRGTSLPQRPTSSEIDRFYRFRLHLCWYSGSHHVANGVV